MNAIPFTTWIAPGIALPAKYEFRPAQPMGSGAMQRAVPDAARSSGIRGPEAPGVDSEVSTVHVAFSLLVAVASILLLMFGR